MHRRIIPRACPSRPGAVLDHAKNQARRGAGLVLEDLVRRLLMANRRFPAVVVTDAVYALGAGTTLAAIAHERGAKVWRRTVGA